MFSEKDRVVSLLNTILKEMELLREMGKDINHPDDFVTGISGMIIFRACGMSLQYITECFVKIRNLCGREFFATYKTVPWDSVFGMRNFLSHEYGDIDAEGFFNTLKNNIPELAATTVIILQDVTDGKMDSFFAKNA